MGGTSAGHDLPTREGRQGADAVTAVVKSGASKRASKAKSHDDLAVASRVLRVEADGIRALAHGLGDSFVQAIDILVQCSGRIVVTGMGKNSHVGRKIAATLASTGSPALFVHPAEASHGDLGMIAAGDAVLLLPQADEACPLGLAPTTSTTMTLALGDALAIALLQRRGFSSSDFQILHPGGQLGRRLLKVADIMHGGEDIPLVPPAASIKETVLAMTAKGFGCAGIVDEAGRLVGIITDGDLRRHWSDNSQTAADVMTRHPKTIRPQALAQEALAMMNITERPFTALFVVEDEQPIGIIHMHDCLRAGVA
jgi:arabinose-5-phosphate isomerase